MTKKLDSAISNYWVVSSITKKARALTLSDKKYVSVFKLPLLGKKFKNYNNDINTYFDNLDDIILEYTYFRLRQSYIFIFCKCKNYKEMHKFTI